MFRGPAGSCLSLLPDLHPDDSFEIGELHERLHAESSTSAAQIVERPHTGCAGVQVQRVQDATHAAEQNFAWSKEQAHTHTTQGEETNTSVFLAKQLSAAPR